MALLGVLVMFVALNLLTYRPFRRNSRDLAALTAVPPLPCYHGRLLTRFSLVAAAQALLLLLSGNFFGAPWNQGYGELAVVLAVYIFAMTGLGLF